MFTLSLFRFSPLNNETHLVALIVGVVGFFVDYFAMPGAAAIDSFSTALVASVCWYIYKVFDGITYDGAETAIGTLAGLAIAVIICIGYFMT